mgnify:CR=1 FL=1
MAEPPIQHITLGELPPTTDPTAVGTHYVDTAYGDQYIAADVGGSLYWVGPMAVGRLETNRDKPTAAPEHFGQRLVTGPALYLGVGTMDMQDWRALPFEPGVRTDTGSSLYVNNDSALAQIIYWNPATNDAPHVLEAPGWAMDSNINMRFVLVRPDASQPLRLAGMADLYCNLPSVLNAGAADVTLSSPVNLVHITHAPGGAWVVLIQPLQAPA